jgi:Vitamin K-dependent gamma-carboxylase
MQRAERFLFPAASAERLAALRIGLCAILAGRLATGPYAELAGQPQELFRPISFMELLPAMPPRPVVVALQVAGVLAAVLAAVGLRTRVALPLAWACAVVLNGMLTSTGKVVHNDLVLLLCVVPLLVAPTADTWSLDARRGPYPVPGRPLRLYGWPLRTTAIVVAGAYFFAGLAKLVHSGPAWVTSDNLRWALYAAGDSQLALFIADRPWLAHALAAGTLLLELSFPLALFVPRAAWILVPGAVLFHAGIWLAMGLDYSAQAATAVVVFTNWPLVVAALRRRRPAPAVADPG